MARTYFRHIAGGGTPRVRGGVITDVQAALNSLSIASIEIDGDFGKQTEDALVTYQTSKQLPVNGLVDSDTWAALMHTAEPPIFERCLQVVASFEGTGFTLIEGNFDGAGLTWGIIGFTLDGGELSSFLGEVAIRFPDLLTQAFGHDTSVLLQRIGPGSSRNDRMAFANEVSGPAPRFRVAEPWRSGFARLGGMREIQRMQTDRARDKYWTAIALHDAQALGMNEELDLLLLFDVAVQNGGMSAKHRLKNAKAGITAGKDAADKRRIVAQVVTDSIIGAFKEDVHNRKMTIATGAGNVHGDHYELINWAFANGFTPQNI